MPAYADRQKTIRPRERAYALAAVVAVQAALGFALLTGLRVPVTRPADVVQKLIDIALPKPPPPPVPPPVTEHKPAHRSSSAPKAEPKPLGGSPGSQPAHAPPSVTPVVAVQPTVAPSGGGAGTGPALGSGAGGGAGGQGYGADEGGTDLEHIAGEILPSDYPPELGRAGVGGRVSVTFTVEVNGRVTGCHVTRSSRVPELDALTCRIIEQRFRFRPSMDRYGRPYADEVDWDHDWIPPRRVY
ncbi:MAG: energy transducer TonB [Sphingomicrobium sp.]